MGLHVAAAGQVPVAVAARERHMAGKVTITWGAWRDHASVEVLQWEELQQVLQWEETRRGKSKSDKTYCTVMQREIAAHRTEGQEGLLSS